jgi:hypothetical protein
MPALDLGAFREARGIGGYSCTIPTILASLDAEHAELLRAALADPTIQSAAIVRVAQKWGVPLRYNPVRRHRARECRCE